MEPCSSDFISNIELIFPAVSLQNVNQGQNITSNPDILSAALRVGLSAALHLFVILQ
jgi:hypothetical protein